MRLSSMADYAVLIMTAAARHCGGERVAASQLAAETGLPVPTAQKLVSQLTASGLLRSARGAGGGLKLARPAAAITLADIVEAVEGPIALTACIEPGRNNGGGINGGQIEGGRAEKRHECTLEEACRLRPHWSAVNDAVRGALAQVPLTSLVETAQ